MSTNGQNNRINRVEAKVCLPVTAAVWLAASVVLGWIFHFIVRPPELVLLIYSNYQKHIENYNVFCLAMIVAILLMPFAFLLIWRSGFSVVMLRRGGGLVFSIMATVGILIGLGAITIDGGNKLSRILRGAFYYLDWLGAVVFSFAGLFLFVSCVAVILNNGRNH